MFEVGNGSRNGGLRGCEAFCGLAHATRLRDQNQSAHILQSYATFNAFDFIHDKRSPYMEGDMTSCKSSIIWFATKFDNIQADHCSSVLTAARWGSPSANAVLGGEAFFALSYGEVHHETSPSSISAAGRGRSCAAARVAHGTGASLPDAAGTHRRRICRRRPG